MNRDIPSQSIWIAGASEEFYERMGALSGTMQVQQVAANDNTPIDLTICGGVLPIVGRYVVLFDSGVVSFSDVVEDRVSSPNTISFSPAPDPGVYPVQVTIIGFS